MDREKTRDVNPISPASVRRRKEADLFPRSSRRGPPPPQRAQIRPSSTSTTPKHLRRCVGRNKPIFPHSPRQGHASAPHAHRSPTLKPRRPRAPPSTTSSSPIAAARPAAATTKKNYFNIEKHLMQQTKNYVATINKLLIRTKKAITTSK